MEHNEKVSGDAQKVTDANAVLANPLAGRTREQLIKEADEFCEEHGMPEHKEIMRKAAQVAAKPVDFDDMEDLVSRSSASIDSMLTEAGRLKKRKLRCGSNSLTSGSSQSNYGCWWSLALWQLLYVVSSAIRASSHKSFLGTRPRSVFDQRSECER